MTSPITIRHERFVLARIFDVEGVEAELVDAQQQPSDRSPHRDESRLREAPVGDWCHRTLLGCLLHSRKRGGQLRAFLQERPSAI